MTVRLSDHAYQRYLGRIADGPMTFEQVQDAVLTPGVLAVGVRSQKVRVRAAEFSAIVVNGVVVTVYGRTGTHAKWCKKSTRPFRANARRKKLRRKAKREVY